jgi:Tfp pilus assembly protein PilF
VVAEYYLLRSDLDNAQKYISAANSIDSTTTYTTSITAQVEYLQARQAIAQQDWGTARNLLMSALNNSEQELAASRLLIEVELESGNLGEAQRLINNLMEQYPAEDTLLLAQARLYELQGDPAKALQYLQSKWYNNASPTLAYNIYQRLNPDPEKQVDFLIKWSRQQPDNDRPLSYLALNAQRSGNNTVAINYYAQAAQLNPRSPSTLNNLAWLYYETNNPLALETAKKAYQLAPDNAAILDTYGWILVVNGKRQEGIELLEKALELATPSDIEGIKSHLSQAKSG